ncbi:hypothetical protein DFJ43DRAFT_1157750 [Lentinula guzmanii]|uniref:Uncharacterized protein n=1 Tax=Lentinula guzmanii TaxID=2804957 RepID=A0AA38JIA6_9AGAR|nr:hypothetical protein DFJ43DRAFT_1157750 [Lentinula guzmanii]
MSPSTPNNDTAQQRRERLLLVQAEQQRARELEIARQEAEEKAAEERALAEEMRLEEELVLEEKRVAEEKQKELAKVAELKAREDKRAADAAEDAEEEREQNTAYVKLVEENRKEWEKAVKELERWQKRAPAAKPRMVDVVVPSRPSGSRSKVFKSKSVISDDSDVMDVDKEQVEAPRGVKRKRPIKMIAKGMNFSEPNAEVEPVPGQVVQPPSESSQPRPAFHGTTSSGMCCMSPTAPAMQLVGDNAACRLRGKRVKVDEDDYEGPAKRAGERRRNEGSVTVVLPGFRIELPTLDMDLVTFIFTSETDYFDQVVRGIRLSNAESSDFIVFLFYIDDVGLY